MKKILLIIFLSVFAWLGGFAGGSQGWCFALKKTSGFTYIYADLDEVYLSRHYYFMLLGYDSRNNLLLFFEYID